RPPKGGGAATAGRARRGGRDRLRGAGPLARPEDRQAAAVVGVRDDAGGQPAHVCTPGLAAGPGNLDPLPRRGLRVLSGGAPAPGLRQPEGRVVRASLYDPKLNRTYAELAQHYGTLVDPCRGGEPTDKACATDYSSFIASGMNPSPIMR